MGLDMSFHRIHSSKAFPTQLERTSKWLVFGVGEDVSGEVFGSVKSE